MSEQNHVAFEGPGPFHLPAAQDARAASNKANGATITFSILRPREQSPDGTQDLVQVSIQMTNDLAIETASRLLAAAEDS